MLTTNTIEYAFHPDGYRNELELTPGEEALLTSHLSNIITPVVGTAVRLPSEWDFMPKRFFYSFYFKGKNWNCERGWEIK